MWSPSPTPEALRVSDESSCTNGSNMRSRSAGVIVGAALETEQHGRDPLAGPVIGHLPPASGLVERETGVDDVARICTRPRRVEGRVLQQPDEFGRLTGGDRRRAPFHRGDCLLIGEGRIANVPFHRRRPGRRCETEYQRVSRVNHSFTIPW